MPTSTVPRVWFITGSSTGLGRALAELILENDEIVVATARNPSTLADLVAKYPAARLLTLPLDVTHPQQVADAFAQAKIAFGRVDVVVNNAGIVNPGEIEFTQENVGRAVMETNFWGAVGVTKEAVRFFRDANPPGAGGRLLQISSYLGLVGFATCGYYAASKFALEGMTECVAAEIDPAWNIKITLVEPGWIRSEAIHKVSWAAQHPAYHNANLPGSRIRAQGMSELVVWKDTRRSVVPIYNVASLPDPPLHLPIGKDAIEGMEQKIAELTAVVDKYRSWSEGLEESG